MPDQTPDGSIVITPADMYRQTTEQFGEIRQTLVHLETVMSPLSAQVAEHDAYLNTLRSAGLPESMTEMKTKVERIDKQQIRWGGIYAGVSAVIGALVAAITLLLR